MANEIGLSEVSSTSLDLITSIVQDTLREKTRVLPSIKQYAASPGAKTVSVPRRDKFSAVNKSENTDLTAAEMTFSVDTISLNKHKAVYAKLEDIARSQSVANVQVEIIKDMAAELADAVDAAIIQELKLASSAAPDHILPWTDDADDKISVSDINNARFLLRSQNVPLDNDLFMLVSPFQESVLLGLSNFIKADEYGSRDALLSGSVGRILGFNVMVSSQLEDSDTLFYHRSAVGAAFGIAPKFEQDRDLKSTSTEYLMHLVFGCKVLDQGLRQVYYKNI